MSTRIFHSLKEAASAIQPRSVAIGNFDGVHRGHAALLRKAAGGPSPSVALTFEPHPAEFFGRTIERLTSPERKLTLIGRSGVDGVIVLPFDEALASMTPEDFADLLRDELAPEHIWVGAGFRFGRGRSGDSRRLKELMERRGTVVHVMRSVTRNGEPVSSSRIRAILKAGDVETAALLLGRAHELEGTVVRGLGHGTMLGFPTINISTSMLIPGPGVYAGFVHLEEECWPAAISVGRRQTIMDDGQLLLEAHILDYSGDLYGVTVSVSFLYRLRNQQKFATEEELVEKIRDDVKRVRTLLIEEELHEETNH